MNQPLQLKKIGPPASRDLHWSTVQDKTSWHGANFLLHSNKNSFWHFILN